MLIIVVGMIAPAVSVVKSHDIHHGPRPLLYQVWTAVVVYQADNESLPTKLSDVEIPECENNEFKYWIQKKYINSINDIEYNPLATKDEWMLRVKWVGSSGKVFLVTCGPNGDIQ